MSNIINRLNKLGIGFFVDPVGLSTEENEKAWYNIIENTKKRDYLLKLMIEAMKKGDLDERDKLQVEYDKIPK